MPNVTRMSSPVPSCQVVDGESEFNAEGIEEFFSSVNLEHVGRDYQVVAIMGPQSSGKSTLMNTVFGTSFQEMNALTGRQQTTKGIWLAKSPKIDEPTTLVMDLEGNDGRERGEDDTSFERQTALFALAVADVVLINMWAKDIGRETGAGKPLLKTIFQVNLRLFTPAPNKRKTVLLFVFRDRTKTPLEKLIEVWETDLDKMWATITKPPQYDSLSFTDFFEVKYSALSNFEEREEDFRAEAVMLRRRFTEDESPDSLVRVSSEKVPGNAVMLSMAKVWEVIKDNKDLNLPAHRVMVANIRCEEIVHDQLNSLGGDPAMAALQEESLAALVPDFGERSSALISSCLTGYDEEARYFEAGVCAAKREDLVAGVCTLVAPLWKQQAAHLQAAALNHFDAGLKEGMDGQGLSFAEAAAKSKSATLQWGDEQLSGLAPTELEWDVPGVQQALADAVQGAIQAAVQRKVSDVTQSSIKTLGSSLTTPTTAMLDSPPADLWPRLQKLYKRGVTNAQQRVADGLAGYDVPAATLETAHAQLQAAADGKLQTHVREAANTALSRLRDRFNDAFSRDEHGLVRSWGPRVNIQQLAASARSATAQVLAQLAVVRHEGQDYSKVDSVIMAMADTASTDASSSSAVGGSDDGDLDILSLSEWQGVPEADVLLQPPQCRTLWRQLMSDSNLVVQQAHSTQEAQRAAQNRMPPVWALAAIVLLGFNEFMAVLYNPIYLIMIAFAFFFGRTVYQELDVDTEMQRGLLPGLLALSAKFVPTVKSVAERTVDTAKHFMADAAHDGQQYLHKKDDGGSEDVASSASRPQEVEMSAAAPGLRKRQPAASDEAAPSMAYAG